MVRAKEQRDVEVACEVDQVRLAAQVLEARQYIVIAEIRRVLPREVDPALLGKVNAEFQVVDLVELAVEARRDPWEALRFAAIDASGSQFVGPAGQSGQQVLELVAWRVDANSLLTPARLRSRSTPVDSSAVRLWGLYTQLAITRYHSLVATYLMLGCSPFRSRQSSGKFAVQYV